MFPTVDTSELRMLAHKLAGANIPYELSEWLGGLRIAYPNDTEIVCSVIQNFGSYGGRNGKLEIMGLLTDEEAEHDAVVGWLTADDVFNRIAFHHSLENAKYKTADCTILGADGEVWEGSMPSWD